MRPALNQLIFLTDQHRHDWLGIDGSVPVRTPNIDALAKRGARMTNAFCPSPLCAPSRACLASGVEYDNSRVQGNSDNFPHDEKTYYKRLRDEAGYHVAGCGKLDLHKASYSWGTNGTNRLQEWGFSDGLDNAGKWDAWDSGMNEPQDPYMAYLHQEGLVSEHVDDFQQRTGINRYTETHPTPLPAEAYCDNWIARKGLKLLEAAPDNRPWHLVVNFAGPHEPMDVTEEMHSWYRGKGAVEFPKPTEHDNNLNPDTHTEIRRNYAAMIENVDRWLGRYLNRLEQQAELSETLVVFASDHGELLGDHGQWGKQSPYHSSVQVPLIMNGPPVECLGSNDALVSLIDLHATLLEAAGLEPRANTDSESLLPLLRGDVETHREFVRSGLGAWRLVFDGRYKLIDGWDPLTSNGMLEQTSSKHDRRNDTNSENNQILFDLELDPDEKTDKAVEKTDIVAQLVDKLRRE